MMRALNIQTILCPNCGHRTTIEIDTSAGDQNFYEECTVCHHEIHLNMHIDQIGRNIELDIETDQS